MTTLGELIKEKGYTQKFIHSKLVENRVNVDYTHFNRWCKDAYAPRHEFVYDVLSVVLGERIEDIRNCFSKNRIVE